jgi:hypothetical protein
MVNKFVTWKFSSAHMSKIVFSPDKGSKSRNHEALGSLPNRRHLTDCLTHTILLTLRPSSAHAPSRYAEHKELKLGKALNDVRQTTLLCVSKCDALQQRGSYLMPLFSALNRFCALGRLCNLATGNSAVRLHVPLLLKIQTE